MDINLLVGTVKGAFLLSSDSAREDWKVEGPLLKGWKVTAASRGNDGDYLLGSASFVYGPAVHRSRDLRDWRQVESSPRYAEDSGFKLEQIWTFGRAGERLLAGVDQAGLFASDDGGETWQLVEGLTDHETRSNWYPGFGGLCAHSVLSDPKDPARLWVGISAVGVFRSEDGGLNWKAKNQGVPAIIEDEKHADIGYCVHALAQDPDDANTIYRQDHKGMFRTRDGGDNWERTENGLPSGFGFPLVIDRRTKNLFAFPLESDEYRIPVDGNFKVWRSRDGADSWEGLQRGLPAEHFYAGVLRTAMATDDLDPCGVYLGTTSGSLHTSNDGGESWRTLPCTLPRILTLEAFCGE